eukprot:scaffold9869_cov117-Skeletonema_dohrnii-CCMP3373.AAC.4
MSHSSACASGINIMNSRRTRAWSGDGDSSYSYSGLTPASAITVSKPIFLHERESFVVRAVGPLPSICDHTLFTSND